MMSRTPRSRQTVNRPLEIAARLFRTMETAPVELAHRSPWELLAATILSAQCTDHRVNQVTPALFARYPTPLEISRAKPAELEAIIKSTGFYKNKAKHLIACGKALTGRFHGKVPSAMEELTSLPGVGRKTANVILGAVFGQPAVVVDTHVKRVANRLHLTVSDDPERIERDVQGAFPENQWTGVSQRLLLHGRYVCLARAPQCGACALYDLCDWKGKQRR